jgi:hypothetical protein
VDNDSEGSDKDAGTGTGTGRQGFSTGRNIMYIYIYVLGGDINGRLWESIQNQGPNFFLIINSTRLSGERRDQSLTFGGAQ